MGATRCRRRFVKRPRSGPHRDAAPACSAAGLQRDALLTPPAAQPTASLALASADRHIFTAYASGACICALHSCATAQRHRSAHLLRRCQQRRWGSGIAHCALASRQQCVQPCPRLHRGRHGPRGWRGEPEQWRSSTWGGCSAVWRLPNLPWQIGRSRCVRGSGRQAVSLSRAHASCVCAARAAWRAWVQTTSQSRAAICNGGDPEARAADRGPSHAAPVRANSCWIWWTA